MAFHLGNGHCISFLEEAIATKTMANYGDASGVIKPRILQEQCLEAKSNEKEKKRDELID